MARKLPVKAKSQKKTAKPASAPKARPAPAPVAKKEEEEFEYMQELADEHDDDNSDEDDDDNDDDDDDDDDDNDKDEDEDDEDDEDEEGENSARKSVTFESTNDGAEEDKVDDLSYDVHNLVACNYHALPIDSSMNKSQIEALLSEHSTRNVQMLVSKIFRCPTEDSEAGPLALLPAETFKLPREKRVPEPKAETKWEKFAKEKGIKNKKRDRMIYDEESDEYKPRFGYKRANGGIEDLPIVEVKAGADPFADPWAEDRAAKKQRVVKNAKAHLKNLGVDKSLVNEKKGGEKGGKEKEYDPVRVPGIPLDLAGGAKRGKAGLKSTMQLVQHSTASMGRFDDVRKGEGDRKIKGKKQSFRDNLESSSVDKAFMKAQLRIVHDKADKKSRGVTNSLAAYDGIIPDAPSDSFRQKKGSGKAKGKGFTSKSAGKRAAIKAKKMRN